MNNGSPVDSADHPADSQLSQPSSPLPLVVDSTTTSPASLSTVDGSAGTKTEAVGPDGMDGTMNGQIERDGEQNTAENEASVGAVLTASTAADQAGAQVDGEVVTQTNGAASETVGGEAGEVEGTSTGGGGREGEVLAASVGVEGATAVSSEAKEVAAPQQPEIVEPTPVNEAKTSSLLASSVALLDPTASNGDATSDTTTYTAAAVPPILTPTPVTPAPTSSVALPPVPSPSHLPTPTAPTAISSSTTTTSAFHAPPLQKKFQSSLSVNKKFLEKAGEKGKVEVKPVATRLATPPIPAPISTSHPRLFAGKLSSYPSLSLSSSSSSASSSTPGWKKPASPSPASAAGRSSSIPAHAPLGGVAGAVGKAAVWGATKTGAGETMGSAGGSGGGGQGGGRGGLSMDFPTAAEAAHAKDARALQLLEQMQARERVLQARAAAAAASNATLLQNLDAFRGVHLDPNAAHWDEDNDDDFLDTTIEFADGTQYKLVEEAQAASRDELREPGPSELALLEKPLAPGEVVEPPRREERFSDDFDRSWPSRQQAAPPPHNLFNDRLGKFEPAASGAAALPKRPSELPSSILSSRAPPSHPPHHHERRPSAGFSDLPPHLSSSHGSAPAPRRPSVTSPPRRRPSVTSPGSRQIPLPSLGLGGGRRESFGDHKPVSVWGRGPSSGEGRVPPPPLAGAGGSPSASGSRPLPPHLQHQQQQQQSSHFPALGVQHPRASFSPPTARTALPPIHPVELPSAAPTAALSPSSAPAPPSAFPAAPAVAPLPPAPAAVIDLEATHLREMHAAAERAKKRREEEEQQRAEQKERAKKKALELEERMRKVEEEKREKEEAAKPVEEKTAASPAALSPVAAPVAVGGGGGSWRVAAKPLAPQATAAAEAGVGGPSRILPREAAPPTQPSSTTLLSPSSSAVQPPPMQPAPWRRPFVPAPTLAPRAPLHNLPPHMALAQAAQQALAAPSSSSPLDAAPAGEKPSPSFAAPLPSSSAPTAAPRNSTLSPPPSAPLPIPSSPSAERKAAAKTANGYKQPAVSQFDDLMSRIKGAMAPPPAAPAAPAAFVEPKGKEKEIVVEVEVPAVKLPVPQVSLPVAASASATPTAAAAAAPPPPASTPPIPVPNVSLPPPTEPRAGRGRGRNVTPHAPRAAPPPPAFENRDPPPSFETSRASRSQSPPPAWRRFEVRLAPYPPRRRPNQRQIKNFVNPHHPRPPGVNSYEPPLVQVNPSRMTRDDWLMPPRYLRGVMQSSVKIPDGEKLVRRTEREEEEKEKPSVSISSRALKRAAAPPPPSKAPVDLPKPTDEVVGSWTAAGQETTAELAPPPPAVAARALSPTLSPTRARNSSRKLPEGSSIGFYRQPGSLPLDDLTATPLERSDSAKMFMVTSELNGEKVETTPRKETTAPGAYLGGSAGKAPSSPIFSPQDPSQVMSSPSSAAAAWGKSLVLNPTVASVWSAPPDDTAVHARAASGIKLENSLQGIADDDPSEALPSSLADLKSEDGISTEDREASKRLPFKADGGLRAAAPSFSSFLHEQAATIDTSVPVLPSSAAPTPSSAVRPHPIHSFSSYGSAQIPPQSTPSPITAYSPAQAYSPQLHPSLQHFGRPPSQQQLYSSYPLSSAQSASPFASQPLHHQQQSYSPQPFPSHSPALQAVGHSSAIYRDPTQPAPPQHITNPALLANYGYGQPVSSASPARGYGAVGANGPGPIGRPQSGAAYGRPPHIPPPPTSYISSGYGGGSPYQPPQALPSQQYRAGNDSPYGFGGVSGGSPQVQHRLPPPPPPLPPSANYSAGTTMASPVIMPQQPPPFPLFSSPSPAFQHQQYPPQQQQQQQGYHHHQSALPSAVQQAAGIPPYTGRAPQLSGGGGGQGQGQGQYGAPGGYPRGRFGGVGMNGGGGGAGVGAGGGGYQPRQGW